MKTIKTNKKMKLNKTTIVNLNDGQMENLVGGVIKTRYSNCDCYTTYWNQLCPSVFATECNDCFTDRCG